MARSETIICDLCKEEAPNSRRGTYRKYHIECAKKVRAQKAKEKRATPAGREYMLAEASKRRARIKADPQLAEHDRQMARKRQDRFRARKELLKEFESKFIGANAALTKAEDALISAASMVNDAHADHERRLRQIEGKLDDLLGRTVDAPETVDGVAEAPSHHTVLGRVARMRS